MQTDQQKLQKLFRKLLAECAKTDDLLVLNHTLPIFHSFIREIAEDRSHSHFFWQDLQERLEKTIKRERLVKQLILPLQAHAGALQEDCAGTREGKVDTEKQDKTPETVKPRRRKKLS